MKRTENSTNIVCLLCRNRDRSRVLRDRSLCRILRSRVIHLRSFLKDRDRLLQSRMISTGDRCRNLMIPDRKEREYLLMITGRDRICICRLRTITGSPETCLLLRICRIIEGRRDPGVKEAREAIEAQKR